MYIRLVNFCFLVEHGFVCLDRNKNNKDKCMFLLYLHANAVNNNKGAGTSSGDQQTSGLAMDFSIKVHSSCC